MRSTDGRRQRTRVFSELQSHYLWEHADLWSSLHYQCGRLVTVRRAEVGISRAEDSLEYAVQRHIVMNPTGLHALDLFRERRRVVEGRIAALQLWSAPAYCQGAMLRAPSLTS